MDNLKIVLFAVVVCILTSCVVRAKADSCLDKGFEEIINNQLSDEDREMLLHEEWYQENINGDSLRNSPILRFYNYLFWACAGQGLDRLLEEALENKIYPYPDYAFFIVFDKEPYKVLKYGTEEMGFVIRRQIKWELDFGEPIPVWMDDLIKLKRTISFNNNECQITGVYLFDAGWQFGAALYITTNNGTFVRAYDREYIGEWYTEAEFKKIADAYYAWLVETAIKDGQVTGGVSSFAEFVSNEYVDEELTKPETGAEKTVDNEKEDKKEKSTSIPFIISGGVLIGVFATVFLAVKKRGTF